MDLGRERSIEGRAAIGNVAAVFRQPTTQPYDGAMKRPGLMSGKVGHRTSHSDAKQNRIRMGCSLVASFCFFFLLYYTPSLGTKVSMDGSKERNGTDPEQWRWMQYSCNGTERRKAQGCIKKGETFSIWLRRQMRNVAYEDLACYIDKAAVKYYVKAMVPGLRTAATIGLFTTENVKDLSHQPLPSRYVLKATHGSNMTLLVTDDHVYAGNKGALHTSPNITGQDLLDLAKKFMGMCFRCKRQAQYRRVMRGVIVEEILGKDYAADYKVFVFGGAIFGFDVRFVNVVDGENGEVRMKSARMVSNGQTELDARDICKHFRFARKFPPEDSVRQILETAKLLADGFRFVRVDFYYVDNTVYFGELTLSPLAGSRHLDTWFRASVTSCLGVCSK